MPQSKELLACIEALDEAPIPMKNRLVWLDGELYSNESGKWERVDAI